MKKLFLSIFFIAIFGSSYAQWNTSGSNIYFNTGSVGIGTTTPSLTLNVDPQGPGGILIGNPSTASGGYTSLMFNISAKQNGYSSIQSTQSSGSSFGNLVLNQYGGNVGIGTTSAPYLLTLNSATYPVASFQLNNQQMFTLAVAGGTNWWAPGSQTGDFVFRSYSTNMLFTTNGGTSTMLALTPSGSVGIGTSAPPTGYLLAVNGSAIATSVTVQAYSSWPDYVFKPKYHLPSLTDLKTYIDLNHHLPEIPSEKEVKKDGLNLGDMNKLLVKKVEELTLYLIDKNKQLKDEQCQISSQKEQLDLAKTQLKDQEERLNKLERQVEKLTKK